MHEETITKRLLISGLTPAISSDDLARRLGSFGSVTALDGLGKLDALGQPRNFAHVTLEANRTQLSKCMNVLSGSTWKGAKLRIGEAKPDFRERILLEIASVGAEDARPRKRRRLARGVHGSHAQDMSLVTRKNAHQRPQWRVTPLGRLIRPMRMRPARPLGLPLNALKTQTLSKGRGKGRKKRTPAVPPTRARRQTIDPLRWGSMHLSGVFLSGKHAELSPPLGASGEGSGSGGRSNGETTEVEEVEEILDASQSPADDTSDMAPHADLSAPHAASGHSNSFSDDLASADLVAEKLKTLQLLNSMFGETNEDWGEAESIDSEMEQDAAGARPSAVPSSSQTRRSHNPIDFEVVSAPQKTSKTSSADQQTQTATASQNTDPMQQSTTLKDLFAPREEEVLPLGFSLIGHLNLDSELDFDLDEPAFANGAPMRASTSHSVSYPTAATPSVITPATTQRSKKALDTTLPFFFPQNLKNPNGHVRFARTEDEAQIRSRWEAARGELTREWKRRHREAVKSRRRRGNGERAE
ncbi:hypothetical protein BC827DRAFT_1385759 [Russula dissimulans]|nr:hypothetical protein BC827DRAFT_1385759 [Russula dissimulans]